MNKLNPIDKLTWTFIHPGTNILGFIAQPREFVKILFWDGSSAIARRHPTAVGKNGKARLYGEGGSGLRFFSLSSLGLAENKPDWQKSWAKGTGGSCYPRMTNFRKGSSKGGILCHHAMYEIWHGPRPEGYELHHLNRDKFDWSDDNLLLVQKGREHANADARQKLIESVVHDLHRLSHAYLRHLTLIPGNDFLAEIVTLNVEQNLK